MNMMSHSDKRPRKVRMIDMPRVKKKAPLLKEIIQVLLCFKSKRIRAS